MSTSPASLLIRIKDSFVWPFQRCIAAVPYISQENLNRAFLCPADESVCNSSVDCRKTCGYEEYDHNVNYSDQGVYYGSRHAAKEAALKWEDENPYRAIHALQCALKLPIPEEGFAKETRDAKLLMDIGSTFLALNKVPECLKYWKQALDMEPTNATFQYSMGVMQQGFGEFREAKGSLEGALSSLGPEDNVSPEALYFTLGNIERSLEDFPSAIRNLEKVRELDPENVDSLALLADCYERRGETGKATQLLAIALDFRPNDHSLKKQLAGVHCNPPPKFQDVQMRTFR